MAQSTLLALSALLLLGALLFLVYQTLIIRRDLAQLTMLVRKVPQKVNRQLSPGGQWWRLLTKKLMNETKQIEAMISLGKAQGWHLPTRKWAASPDILWLLTSLVRRIDAKRILDIGSGISTIRLAQASSADCRIISIDSNLEFAHRTRALVELASLTSRVEIRSSDLIEYTLDGVQTTWYERSVIDGIADLDLVFVDGPPASNGSYARFAALPLIYERLAPDCILVLDDLVREDEQRVFQRWLQMYPEFSSAVLDLEKGVGLLGRGKWHSLVADLGSSKPSPE
jgi:predicted O-methyltransferase YrrM